MSILNNTNSKHGGARAGSGRPKVKIRSLSKTKPMRVPLEIFDDVKSFIKNKRQGYLLYSMEIESGIPVVCKNSKFTKYNDNVMIRDVDRHFLVKASDQMNEFGIMENDILSVDRNKKDLKEGNLFVVTNKFDNTVIKKLHKKNGRYYLVSSNKDCPDIDIENDSPFQIMGVIVGIYREVCQ